MTYKSIEWYEARLEEYQYLQALVFDFRNKIVLNGGLSDFSILRKFDEHFGIVTHTHGEINKDL